jgi:hypothetical protein
VLLSNYLRTVIQAEGFNRQSLVAKTQAIATMLALATTNWKLRDRKTKSLSWAFLQQTSLM